MGLAALALLLMMIGGANAACTRNGMDDEVRGRRGPRACCALRLLAENPPHTKAAHTYCRQYLIRLCVAVFALIMWFPALPLTSEPFHGASRAARGAESGPGNHIAISRQCNR
jgi:hypothetical protein